jgi:NitT/TauT family transport system ATP-binding protein
MNKIEIRNLKLEYGQGSKTFLALDNINVNIGEGEFVCILGASGCGKSTLLSVLGGLSDSPATGGVYIDGKNKW